MALGWGSRFAPWIWLPLAFTVLLACLFATERWIRQETPFLSAMSFSLVGGVTSGWLSSATSFASRTPLFVFFALVTAGGVIKAVVAFERVPTAKRRPAVGLFVVVAMAWVISVASSSHAGAGGMIDWVIAHLGLSESAAHQLVLVVRKSIHFTFYGSLGLVAGATSRGGRASVEGSPKPNPWTSARFGFLTVLLVASFDELRQSTQPGRTGSIYDILLDLSGALVFLAVYHVATTRAQPPT